MRQFLKTCRECWIVTLFIVVMFIINGARICLDAKNHDFSLPVILRILDVLR
jgi:hypothetical protein